MARTYTLDSLDAKIANFEQFIERADAKKVELVKLRDIRAGLLNPENLVKAETRLERMQRDIANLEKSIAASKERKEREESEREFAENSGSDETPDGWETAETGTEETPETD